MNEKETRLYNQMTGIPFEVIRFKFHEKLGFGWYPETRYIFGYFQKEKTKAIHKALKQRLKKAGSHKANTLSYKMKRRNGSYLGEHEVKITSVWNGSTRVYKGRSLCHESEGVFHPLIGVVLAEYRLLDKLWCEGWHEI